MIFVYPWPFERTVRWAFMEIRTIKKWLSIRRMAKKSDAKLDFLIFYSPKIKDFETSCLRCKFCWNLFTVVQIGFLIIWKNKKIEEIKSCKLHNSTKKILYVQGKTFIKIFSNEVWIWSGSYKYQRKLMKSNWTTRWINKLFLLSSVKLQLSIWSEIHLNLFNWIKTNDSLFF